jgi:hypothetical protein
MLTMAGTSKGNSLYVPLRLHLLSKINARGYRRRMHLIQDYNYRINLTITPYWYGAVHAVSRLSYIPARSAGTGEG